MTMRLIAAIVTLVAVAPAPAHLAADWYIKGETGSDLNSGLSPSEPRQTFPPDAAIASGDTFHVAERCRSSLVVDQLRDNITVRQWSGQAPAQLRGDTPVRTGWTQVGATNAWEMAIGAGKELNNSGTPNDAGDSYTGSVVHNWDIKIDQEGRHYGHLSYGTRAQVEAAGGVGRYHYSATTGVLAVNLGGPSPNQVGEEVAYCDAKERIAIAIVSGAGHVIRDVSFALYPTRFLGYGVILVACTDSLVDGCTAWDMGAHAFGGTASAVNIRFVNCTARGLHRDGTHFVWFTSGPDLAGCAAERCTAWAYRYRNFDNTGVPLGIADPGQIGFFAHGPGFGTPIHDLLIDECTFRTFEDGGAFAAGSDALPPAVSEYTDWAAYPVRVRAGRVLGAGALFHFDWMAYRGTKFHLPYTGAQYSGYGAPGGISLGFSGNIGRPRRLLLESCEIVVNLDGPPVPNAPTRLFALSIGNADDQMIRINCSIHNTGTQPATNPRVINDWGGRTDRAFLVRGEVVEFKTLTDQNMLCIADGEIPAADHDMLDGVYRNIGSDRYSQNPSLDSESEWLAKVDTQGGHVEAAPIFPDAPGSLALAPGSPIWTDRRATTGVVPAAGLNGPYTGFFGAYQYRPCSADCTLDGSLTIADLTCFQAKFVAGDPYADCNQSGSLTISDFTCYQAKFVAGCP